MRRIHTQCYFIAVAGDARTSLSRRVAPYESRSSANSLLLQDSRFFNETDSTRNAIS